MTLPGDCPLPWRGRGVSADKAWLDHLATSTKCVALNNTWSHAYFLHESRLLWTPLVYIHFNIKIVFKRTETPTALFLLSSIHALCHCKSAVNKDIVSMYPSAGSVVMRTTTTKDLRAGTLRGSKAKFRYTKRERERERERDRERQRDRETETECERAKELSTYQVRSSSARHPSFEVYSWRYRTKVLSEREEVDK